jgi:4-amino-4-deoxy-L-arabinose transferase-like glycosyltransferase
LVLLFVLAVGLMAFNLPINPHPWHDEGAAMLVSKTLVQDGIYAARSGDGYQTFGPIQSVGPTVLVPVAIIYRLLGVGIWQGRLVAIAYGLFALAMVFAVAARLFGWKTGILAALVVLGAPPIEFLLHSRQVSGEIPALAFFLCSWLVWAIGREKQRGWLSVLAGVLLGLAMITKSQYLLMGLGMVAVSALLDAAYYKTGSFKSWVIVGVVAGLVMVMWYGWQRLYYGPETFAENAAKLSALAANTAGFYLSNTVEALRYLIGTEFGAFHYFWGLAALVYVGVLAIKREWASFRYVPLLFFTIGWLLYFLFYSIPWPQVAMAPAVLSAVFVAKLWRDLWVSLNISWSALRRAWRDRQVNQLALMLAIMAVVGLAVIVPLQSKIRTDVLEADRASQEVVAFIAQTVEPGALIETWERELGIMTDRQYHYPDQSMLAKTHLAIYRNGPRDYALGAAYFQQHQPQYLVVGWFGRWLGIYDKAYIQEHGEWLASFGPENERYDVYRLGP